MSNIKDKRKENDDDELLKYFQNAETVIRQESNIILEETIQSETKNDNEKIFNHEFSEDYAVDYTAFVEKKDEHEIKIQKKRILNFF